MADSFDVIVIGAGPGGYIAAIRAAQLGFRVACIDDWQRADGKPALGGTCTNVGCIPSKALLQSSEHFEHAAHGFAAHGIDVKGLAIDVPRMIARKEQVVRQNNDGILFLFKKNKVAFYHGRGAFAGGSAKSGWLVAVSGDAPAELTAPHVIVATGSKPRPLPGVAFDHERVLDNAGALALGAVPKRLGVVGAGVIGLEMGSVWRRLGAEVTVLEALPAFLGAADEAVAKEAHKLFAKQGLAIHLGVAIESVVPGKKGVDVGWKAADGAAQSATFDRLIVAIGRAPNTEGLNASSVGLAVDARGFVVVDAECRTNLPQVWAIGDVVRGPMLAHKAEDEGVAVAERIAGQHGHVDFDTIPWVIYTSPEIAWVGRTEQQLRAEGVAYRAGSFPFSANGRARALGDTRGFVKLLADATTDRILGMHVIGPFASELIAEGVMAMEFGASAEDIARICHAHPSLSEATREAALAVDRRTLNL
jgi:dihydrolipoamide dehydrogenase